MATIEERLGTAERVGEQVNRVIDLYSPAIGALVRVTRRLITAAKARGEDVGTAEAELDAVEAGIAETQTIVDAYKALRAGERAGSAGARAGMTLLEAGAPVLRTTIRVGRSVEQILRAQGREVEAIALAAELTELEGTLARATGSAGARP